MCSYYRGAILVDENSPKTLYACPSATPDQIAALERLQAEDRDAHQLAYPPEHTNQTYRSIKRAMRVRFFLLCETAAGQLAVVGTKFINGFWGGSDTGADNKTHFGPDHIVKLRVLNSGVQNSTTQWIVGPEGLRHNAGYVRQSATQRVTSGTRAEWSKPGQQNLYTTIDSIGSYLEGHRAGLTIKTVKIQLTADGSVSIPGYPPLVLPTIVAEEEPVAAPKKKIRRGKKNKKAASDDDEESEEGEEQSQRQSKRARTDKIASAAPAPPPRCNLTATRRRRSVSSRSPLPVVSSSNSTVGAISDSEDQTDAESVPNSDISEPPSPARVEADRRFLNSIDKGDEEQLEDADEIEEIKEDSQKAPTASAAASSIVPAPASPVVSEAYEAFPSDVQIDSDSDASLASLMALISPKSAAAAASSSSPRVHSSPHECMEMEQMFQGSGDRSTTPRSLFDENDEQREMKMFGAAGRVHFDRSESPRSFDAYSAAASSMSSLPSPDEFLSSISVSSEDAISGTNDEESSSQSEASEMEVEAEAEARQQEAPEAEARRQQEESFQVNSFFTAEWQIQFSCA